MKNTVCSGCRLTPSDRFFDLSGFPLVVISQVIDGIACYEPLGNHLQWYPSPLQHWAAASKIRINDGYFRLLVAARKQAQPNRDAPAVPYNTFENILHKRPHLLLAASAGIDQGPYPLDKYVEAVSLKFVTDERMGAFRQLTRDGNQVVLGHPHLWKRNFVLAPDR